MISNEVIKNQIAKLSIFQQYTNHSKQNLAYKLLLMASLVLSTPKEMNAPIKTKEPMGGTVAAFRLPSCEN